jgi:predicted alpha/beta hydrolase family esterase
MNYIFLAGIGNSEPDHWQSIWFRGLGGRWVDHADWERPRADEWVADLERAVQEVAGPKVFIGHSLGCLLAVEWARSHRNPDIRGSFLVAVPDVGGPNFPKAAVGFAPADAHSSPPPLPALVVASTTDPYGSFASARSAAKAWGAAIASVGDRGHINLASNLGAWDEGRALFDRFLGGLGGP